MDFEYFYKSSLPCYQVTFLQFCFIFVCMATVFKFSLRQQYQIWVVYKYIFILAYDCSNSSNSNSKYSIISYRIGSSSNNNSIFNSNSSNNSILNNNRSSNTISDSNINNNSIVNNYNSYNSIVNNMKCLAVVNFIMASFRFYS